MRIQRITPILNKLQPILQAVKIAEKKYCPQPDDKGVFDAQGPRYPVYGRTCIPSFLENLSELSRLNENLLSPKFHFADLGSGLGLACFAASFIFNKITGIEFDQRLYLEAEQIRQQFKIKTLERITFINQDFLDVDLWPFDVIYFYKPFVQNFYGLMREKLADTSPGTIVISYLFIKGSLFDPDIFRPIYPPNWGFEEEMESKIYVAKRR